MNSREIVVLKWLLEQKGWSSPTQTKEEFISEFKSLTKDVQHIHTKKGSR